MSKVANPFWQPSVLIETPAYPYNSTVVQYITFGKTQSFTFSE